MATVKEALADGWKFHQAGDLKRARNVYEQVAAQLPENASTWCYLGILHFDLDEFERSESCYRKAISLQPDFPVAWGNLGNTLAALDRYEEAIEALNTALKQRPGYKTAIQNLIAAQFRTSHFDDAYETLRRVTNEQPDDAGLRMTFGILKLLRCEFESGWPDYEWRFKTDEATLPNCSQPYWDGSPLAGRSLMLACEQGLGDAIQFVRFAPILKSLGAGRVVVQTPTSLLPLFRSFDGADEFVGKKQPIPQTDIFAPMLSIPRLLKMHSNSDFPAETPYLEAEPERVSQWAGRLDPDKLKVAICWQGNPKHKSDARRSASLTALVPLGAVPGVQLISVQKFNQATTEELDLARARSLDILDFGEELDADAAFLDTAAIMAAADLVISIDTSIIHLAGALGVPAWVALTNAPDWRWQLERDDTPWYPSMRLFRQKIADDWAQVFEEMAQELRLLVQARGGASCRSIPVAISPGELIDKLTILQIKTDRLNDEQALANVRLELAQLTVAREREIIAPNGLSDLESQLRQVNETLWQVEDDLRICEKNGDFGPDFVELARSVYRLNDRRGGLKREINALLGSELVEEKSYEDYA